MYKPAQFHMRTVHTYTLTKDELPACCPPSDSPHWNLHPKVYLMLNDKNPEVTCPYCGNVFELQSEDSSDKR